MCNCKEPEAKSFKLVVSSLLVVCPKFVVIFEVFKCKFDP